MDRIKHWWRRDVVRSRVLVIEVLIVVALGSLFVTLVSGDSTAGFGVNLATEMIGAIVTYALLTLVLGRQEADEELKTRLILEMGSDEREVAVPAADKLRARGWLTDGTLRGAILVGTNLQKADLEGANLQRAHLEGANLQGAYLEGANLQGAFFFLANLQGAYLEDTNLQGAYLASADLQGIHLFGAELQRAILAGATLKEAYLKRANLQGASLWGANLQEAVLVDVLCDSQTVLPDRNKWSPDTDWNRFTDPEHPDFWCSGPLPSTAYRGGVAADNGEGSRPQAAGLSFLLPLLAVGVGIVLTLIGARRENTRD